MPTTDEAIAKGSAEDNADLESCSWDPDHIVPAHTLTETHDGALVCLECIQQHLRDSNLPCAGCNARWEGPRRDCMDHAEDCSYMRLES